MIIGKLHLWLIVSCTLVLIIKATESKSTRSIRSDVIQTKFGPEPEDDSTKPGWMVQFLL